MFPSFCCYPLFPFKLYYKSERPHIWISNVLTSKIDSLILLKIFCMFHVPKSVTVLRSSTSDPFRPCCLSFSDYWGVGAMSQSFTRKIRWQMLSSFSLKAGYHVSPVRRTVGMVFARNFGHGSITECYQTETSEPCFVLGGVAPRFLLFLYRY